MKQEKMWAPSADMVCSRPSICQAYQVLTINYYYIIVHKVQIYKKNKNENKIKIKIQLRAPKHTYKQKSIK